MKSASSGACCWQSKGLFFLMQIIFLFWCGYHIEILERPTNLQFFSIQINFCFDACGDIFFDIFFWSFTRAQRENRCWPTTCLLCCCWWTKLVNSIFKSSATATHQIRTLTCWYFPGWCIVEVGWWVKQVKFVGRFVFVIVFNVVWEPSDNLIWYRLDPIIYSQ